jgi:polysaccharide export outer membrane protein
LLLVLAGCTALPGSGPISGQVVAGPGCNVAPYELVKLNSDVVSVVGKQPVPGFGHVADKSVSPQLMLGVGDVVSVTIYEAADGGLFIPGGSGSRPGNFVTLPDQNVDNAGNIMPYAGAIKAAGRSISEIQEEIVSRLSDRAIEPQVASR